MSSCRSVGGWLPFYHISFPMCVYVQLTSGVGGGTESGDMSKFRATASPDGQSETQTVEFKIRSRDEEEETIGNGATKDFLAN